MKYMSGGYSAGQALAWRGILYLCLCFVYFYGAQTGKTFAGEETIEATGISNKSPLVFSFDDVDALAKKLAAEKYLPPETAAPDLLNSLSFDQWLDFSYDFDPYDRWKTAKTSLYPRFHTPGYVFSQIAKMNIVTRDDVEGLEFSPELFSTDDKDLAGKICTPNMGFAGFTLCPVPPKAGNSSPGIMAASHFQFCAKNARFGPFARPVTLNAALPSGELFSHFREFWLCEPGDDSEGFTVYALMDSPALTGAFEMVITTGSAQVVDVRSTFYTRQGTASPAKIGLAPISAMYLYSEIEGGGRADYRPEIHNADGLLAVSDKGEWLWTPLKNPQRLAISSASLNNPRGFGLIQRDNNFDHYQDLKNRYDRASSLWVEPVGEWGPGKLELMEIPSAKDYHSNIMAYWTPEPAAADAPVPTEGTTDPGKPFLSLAYKLYWMPPATKLHELAFTRDTRIQRSVEDKSVTFVIDFEGDELNKLTADTGLTSVVEFPKETTLLEKQLMKNEVTDGWRLTLKFSLPQAGVLDSLLAAREGPPHLAFSAYLKKGENLVEALTEVWRYNLIP
jgi:Periplasmic glucans biosynthesis protein